MNDRILRWVIPNTFRWDLGLWRYDDMPRIWESLFR